MKKGKEQAELKRKQNIDIFQSRTEQKHLWCVGLHKAVFQRHVERLCDVAVLGSVSHLWYSPGGVSGHLYAGCDLMSSAKPSV